MTTSSVVETVPSPASPQGGRSLAWIAIVVLLLVGLPLAVWADLRALSRNALLRQTGEISRIINDVRNFYANDVVARVIAAKGDVHTSANYRQEVGGIPIPATFSLELGKLISDDGGDVSYRFVSDFPFAGREPHSLDAFERNALTLLRRDPSKPVVDVSGPLFSQTVRLATPVVMGETCVKCHNSHPDSPKKDWVVGDVRGIQEVTVGQPIEANLFAFKYLLAYFVFAGRDRAA